MSALVIASEYPNKKDYHFFSDDEAARQFVLRWIEGTRYKDKGISIEQFIIYFNPENVHINTNG